MATWRYLISEEMDCQGECWEDIEFITMTGSESRKKFDHVYEGLQGIPFTLRTEERVYFPAVYDGTELVESVPRNPCNELTAHVGSE